MHEYDFTITVVTRTYDDGTKLAEALLFPEVSRYGNESAEINGRLRAGLRDVIGKREMRAITAKELGEVAAREGLTKLDGRLRWAEAAVARLTEEGFDRRYGARPLQRVIEKLVVVPLARYLAEHPATRDADIFLSLPMSSSATPRA